MVDYAADDFKAINDMMKEKQKAEGRNPEPIEQLLDPAAPEAQIPVLYCKGCAEMRLAHIDMHNAKLRAGLLTCAKCPEVLVYPYDQEASRRRHGKQT